MDFLTENPLATMPGPAFLIFYALAAVAALGVFVGFEVEATGGRPPQAPARPDPYELAYLRDGVAGVVWLAIYGLKRAGRLDLGPKGVLKPQSGGPPADRYEAAVLAVIGSGKTAAATIRDIQYNSVISQLDLSLRAKGLTRTARERALIWRFALALIAALVALAVYKIVVAIAHGRSNVGFLIMECAVAVVVLALAAARRAGRTANSTGRDYLDRVRLAHGGSGGGAAGTAAMLLVGLYGYEALAGGPDAAFAQAARKTQASGGSCGGGSCSSGGSSCGSGGGGGCGGCGGGD